MGVPKQNTLSKVHYGRGSKFDLLEKAANRPDGGSLTRREGRVPARRGGGSGSFGKKSRGFPIWVVKIEYPSKVHYGRGSKFDLLEKVPNRSGWGYLTRKGGGSGSIRFFFGFLMGVAKTEYLLKSALWEGVQI